MRPRPPTAVLALVLACAAGCLSLAKQSSPIHQFMPQAVRPQAERSQASAPAAGAPTLVVHRLEAVPAFAGREFVYRTGEFAYEKDFYNEWLEEPAAAVTPAAEGWLAQSGLFAHVVAAGAGVQGQYVLKGQVLELYGDYRRSGSPAAVVRLRFTLLKGSGPDAAILLEQDYAEDVPAGDGSPAALAGAWSQALTQALQALEKDVASALKG
jgi:ABC-type uncharacterized transport system auxiliary subunit